MRRTARAGLVAAAAFGVLMSGVGVASADPITCPGKQVSERVDGEWRCVNPGGNTSGADETKNPND